jgi:STE24 endopeptidase
MRIGRLATLVALGCAWLGLAALLWRTSVPADLHVNGLDVHRYFSPVQLARAARFMRFFYVLWGLHLVAALVALVVVTRRAPRIVWTLGLGRIGRGLVVGGVMLLTLWLVSLPFDFAAEWWTVRHGLAPRAYLTWFLAPLPQVGVVAVLAMALIAIVLWLAGRFGERWWLAGAPLFAAISLSFALLGGYLAGLGTQPIASPALRAAVQVLEQREHVAGTPVTVEKASAVTNEVNAFSDGFGPSSHVVLWDTLLRLAPGEVRFTAAHELGHVARRHVLKAVGWSLLVYVPLAWLVTLVARRRGGLANPASLPLALLTLVVTGFVAKPVENAVSRRYEAEADWSALRAIHDPASGRRLFVDFQRTSLAQPSPPLWAYLWLEDHPTLAQRIAMVERFATSSRTSRSPATESQAGS